MSAPIRWWEPKGQPFEPEVKQQVFNIAKVPVVEYVCLMPDGHMGIGGPVGGVIQTKSAIIPALVGVDIGCGMIAMKTDIDAGELDGMLPALRAALEDAVPTGGPGAVGSWGSAPTTIYDVWRDVFAKGYYDIIDRHPGIKSRHGYPDAQLGTLGTGNHFIEICVADDSTVWFMLHSGSRGVGNRIGSYFIELAREQAGQKVPDRDLHWLDDGTQLFDDYVQGLEWAQDYARMNRSLMMERVTHAVASVLQRPVLKRGKAVNCHHNYVETLDPLFGERQFITRKGAVSAKLGELGIIPGSMGAKSFIVRGLGNEMAMHSCSHGAGRRMSRGAAKRAITEEQHALALKDVECRKDASTIDESPSAYKDIDAVMAAQVDLVTVVATLKQVVCVKG